MALGRREVDEPALGQEVHLAPVRERELLDERPRLPRLGRERPERRDVDLDVEVPRVREDGAVLEPFDVLARDDVLVAGGGDEDVSDLGAFAIGITWKPSITASRAFIASTSVTITCAPRPLARIATPRPHQP